MFIIIINNIHNVHIIMMFIHKNIMITNMIITNVILINIIIRIIIIVIIIVICCIINITIIISYYYSYSLYL